ncbi:MAG: 2-dehydropantoate 2-reductase [Gammaproteobacteria bacterium]|nr:2-dehydropantoate 2-reductase [Gammaproteobacteria bacterium]NIV49648.1 2-dehydropantoate 2-reductase [Gammaproteobacteria bacterium]
MEHFARRSRPSLSRRPGYSGHGAAPPPPRKRGRHCFHWHHLAHFPARMAGPWILRASRAQPASMLRLAHTKGVSMKIAVMGAGGMGGWLGAKLAAAGSDVTFLARGAHLEAIRASGLRVTGAESLRLGDAVATDRPDEIGPVDVVLFCVKLYDTESAAKALAPLLGPETFVVTVQNGVESTDRIGKVIGDGRTLAGAAYFPANIAAPGEVAYLGRIEGKPHIAFGEPGAGSSKRACAFAEICRAAAIDAEVFEDTDLMIWEKFCLIAGTSASTALTRQTVGVVRNDPDMRWFLSEAIAEAARVGRRLGVALADDTETRILDFIDHNPPNGKSSQLVDLERGRRLELDGLSGAVVRLGKQAGVPTPVHATVYAALKPFVDGAPGAQR